MTKCSHKAEHKEVLGSVLCVCCTHCQRENERLKKALEDIKDHSGKNPFNTQRWSNYCHTVAYEALGVK